MKITKQKVKKEISGFFKNIRGKSPNDIKKIKKKAMSHSIRLGKLRRKFCKNCLTPYTIKTAETRVKKGKKIVRCKKCGSISRWEIK